jgi:hypothetical protein
MCFNTHKKMIKRVAEFSVALFDINEKTTRLSADYKVYEYTFLRHILDYTQNEEVIAVLRANGAKMPDELEEVEQSNPSSWFSTEKCMVQ